jgi:hypothetical protein
LVLPVPPLRKVEPNASEVGRDFVEPNTSEVGGDFVEPNTSPVGLCGDFVEPNLNFKWRNIF